MSVIFGDSSDILSNDFTEVTLSGIDISEVKNILSSDSNMDAIVGLINSISSDVDKLLKYRGTRIKGSK